LQGNGGPSELQNANLDLSVSQFNEWAADKKNYLIRDKELSDIKYQLSFMPKECLAYRELKNAEYSKEQFEEAKKHYEGMSYFNFRMEVIDGTGELLKHRLSSANEYNNRINYLAFEMQKDIFLVQGKDTLYPGLYHFERVFEAAPYTTIMLAFDNLKFNPEKEFTVVCNDKLFNKGYIKYNYRTNQIIDLPNITGV
jgi:hypothetical protein